MADSWYYVQAGDRKGPVEEQKIVELITNSTLGSEDYVWRKGLDNWIKIHEASEFSNLLNPVDNFSEDELPDVIDDGEVSLRELAGDENCIFIKIGADRGTEEVEYGPYPIDLLVKLFEQKRINAKTFAFIKGMKNWQVLGDFTDFSEVFEDSPPPIKDEDRRASRRKPFIARMYIENKKEVFVGICRDISVGGMQVLVDHFPGRVGEKIAINVHPENTEYNFVADGKIVRSLDGGQGFSFRFMNLSSESQNAIQRYLDSEQ